jgi:hypothetical protein
VIHAPNPNGCRKEVKTMTPYLGYLAAYQRIRPTKFRLNNILAQTLSKSALNESGRRLGILKGGVLVFGSEDELAVLMDYAIYNCPVNGRNAVQQYFEKTPPRPQSEEMAVLKALLEARYTLFEVSEAVPGVGLVVKDLRTGDAHFLCDINLGSTATIQMVLATRVVAMEGFVMTGGAALPVTPAAMKRIARRMENLGSSDFRPATQEEEADLVAFIIRACLGTGSTSRVAYLDPVSPGLARRTALSRHAPSQASRPALTSSQSHVEALTRTTPQVGRSTRCPCGSGRKYKACCGRS